VGREGLAEQVELVTMGALVGPVAPIPLVQEAVVLAALMEQEELEVQQILP